MSEDEKIEKYFDEQATSLSEISEIPKEDILAEFRNKIIEEFSPRGAVMWWKSQHRKVLGVGESKNLKIRVVGKGTPRDGTYGKYAYMEFLVQDDGLLEVKSCSFSDASLPKMDLLNLNVAYEVQVFEKSDGSLTRLRGVVEVDDDKVPRVEHLSAYDFPFPELGKLDEFVGSTKLLHGWVGGIKVSRQTGEKIGFEFGDDSTLVAPIMWFGYSHEEIQEIMRDLEDGDELYICAYIKENERGINGDVKGVFKVE